jgi:hypothetical protein
MHVVKPDDVPQPLDVYRGVEIYLRWCDEAAPEKGREFYCTAVPKALMTFKERQSEN